MRLAQPETDAPLVDWALYWAGRGWQVFPLCSPDMGEHSHRRNGPVCDVDVGKAPMIGEGFKGGTCNVAEIRKWWAKWPNANIGSTPPAGQVVLDVDGPLDDGTVFPETQTHGTGKGKHLIYVNNLERPLPQTQTDSRLWTNVDTRVSGRGYIVLPPSKHRSGACYTILDNRQPVEFPTALVPVEGGKHKSVVPTVANDEVLRLLTLPRDHADLGDGAMTRIAGWLARYVPTEQHFSAVLSAINLSLSDPLDDVAMAKKAGVWRKHQESIAADASRKSTDESRGWLFELGDTGYSTPIERAGGKVEYVPWSDFRVEAKGLIVSNDNQIFIVDFVRADGSRLENQRLSAVVLASTAKLREWLARRGMVLHDNRADSRASYGVRLMKLMQSQNPPVLSSRDYYGWCPETEAFLTPVGEIVPGEGLRSFTKIYPEDELSHCSPTSYQFSSDLSCARDWLSRILRLQDERESVKVGAWLMMLLLRGQWQGRLSGLIVEASAGIGKTVFWQLISRIAGTTNDGEDLTVAAARDMLSGNLSGFVWLDDVATKVGMEELIRKTITQGRVSLKEKTEGGKWRTSFKQLRGSVVISGEGTDFYRQKAQRDRFINVEFSTCNRTDDAERLMHEPVSQGSGALLTEVLRHASMLSQLDTLLQGVNDRDKQAQTTLRMGARILDAVLLTDHHYTDLIDNWYFDRAIEADLGHASENVLHVLPTIWVAVGTPVAAGVNGLQFPIWYDRVNSTFWINGKLVAEHWNNRRNVNDRQRQLTSQDNIRRELDACGAGPSVPKRGGEKVGNYRQLPKRYSDMIIQRSEVSLGDENGRTDSA